MTTKKLAIDIIAKDKSQQALNQVQGNLNKTKSSVLNLKNALIGLGAGLAIKSIVNIGSEVENLGVRFKFLFGSADQGALAFANLTKFASKVPFSLEAITKASGSLAVVAKDAGDLNRVLEITGNVAAVSGLDFETAAMQIQRAFSGGISAADLFRERGVNALLGFKAGATVSVEETIAKFEEVFSNGGRFAGATDALAQTFQGTLSMLGDKVFNFQKTIAEAGFFPEIKKQFGDLNNTLEENEQIIDQLAKKIGVGLARAVKMVADGFKTLADNADLIFGIFAGIIALKVATAFVGIATAITTMKFAMIGFNTATKANLVFGGIAIFIGTMALLITKMKEFKAALTDGSIVSTVTDFKSAALAIAQINAEIDALPKKDKKLTNAGGDSKKYTILKKQLEAIEELNLKFESNRISKSGNAGNRIIELSKAEYGKKILAIQDSFLDERQLVLKKNEEDLAIIDKFLEEELNITRAQKNHLEDVKKEIYERGVADIALIAQKELDAVQALEDEKTRILDEANKERIENIRNEGSVLENLKENYAAFFKDFNEGKLVADALTDTFAELTKGIGDAIAQSIVFGKSFKQTFGDVARQALASLISALVQIGVQMAVNAIITKLGMKTSEETTVKSLKAIKKEATPTAFLVSLATAGSNAFGAIAGTIATFAVTKALAGRRTGGQVTGGTPYMVGEQGQEMFVPNQSGTIVPNDRLGGGQTINVNIHANDTQGFDELLIKRRATIVNVINDALNSQGKEALV